MMLLRLRERFSCWAGFRLVLTRKGIDAMCKAYKKGRRKRRDAGGDEAETSADESRADPGTGEPEQTASAAEGTLGRGTRRAATSTDYGGPPSPDDAGQKTGPAGPGALPRSGGSGWERAGTHYFFYYELVCHVAA
ncbi:hypothetical protein EMIHUDRAFT_225790 [Emiliania huxleyi CCMP1516]|uniref:Uncharacterized protein n=2 Tax=Emiliania huxleyi TaxID=2903 RepID=A0A0D3KNH9_EMIH1|nr:hypothetical protein EMIHUDRAFT_225790 [Emiliania huxleyi CCMP1516]EOD37314.1 hypothetical protein EMIHUDRAFT_225790 [Emiliania huxleyi CCMP1516]|eukprot:XP_005789743.1 hypothetical protein EMIHUDRAFT_225790 [Emiliania huxleyi CCMP1516]